MFFGNGWIRISFIVSSNDRYKIFNKSVKKIDLKQTLWPFGIFESRPIEAPYCGWIMSRKDKHDLIKQTSDSLFCLLNVSRKCSVCIYYYKNIKKGKIMYWVVRNSQKLKFVVFFDSFVRSFVVGWTPVEKVIIIRRAGQYNNMLFVYDRPFLIFLFHVFRTLVPFSVSSR